MSQSLYLNGLTVNSNVLSGLADLSSTSSADSAANKRYVDTAIQGTADAAALSVTNLIASAPDALNTLKELATALGDDANFATTVTNSLAAKATILSLTTETDRAIAAEGVLRGDLAAELIVARAAEKVLRDDLAAELVVARAAEGVLRTDLATLEGQHDALQVLHTALSASHQQLKDSTTTSDSILALNTHVKAMYAYFFSNGSKPDTLS
jgi:hypothetical protein